MHKATYVVEAGKSRRKSSFQEMGLDDGDSCFPGSITSAKHQHLRNIAEHSTQPTTRHDHLSERSAEDTESDLSERNITITPDTPVMRTSRFPLSTRLMILAVLLATIVPLAQNSWLTNGKTVLPTTEAVPTGVQRGANFAKRDNSPTDVCKRWSGQSAIINGTLYYYGGRSITSQGQLENQWNNDLISIDLTKSWEIGSPTFSGLPQPSGPPAVSNGYLWNSHSALYLYGGEFQDQPAESPVAFSLWEYDIASSSWKEHSNPQTSSGTNSESSGLAVQRVAEGAGASMPALGRGWYFGGHQDYLTTEGWSNQVAREYLTSFVEFTFPGTPNNAVQGLSGDAGSDGAWRNITKAGIQTTAGFTERADGVLVYIPGFSKDGILVALAGGTNDTQGANDTFVRATIG